MSLFNQISSAALQAQGTLAQMMGAPSTGRQAGKNGLYQGRSYSGVYGPVEVERLLLPTGGERVRQVQLLTVTREQFEAAPKGGPGQKWVRTDLNPQATFTIDHVNDQDATVYTLRLVRAVS